MQTSTLEITLLSPVTVATVSPLFTAYRLRFPPFFSWYDKFERFFQLIYVCTQRSELETPSKEVSFALCNGKGSGKLSKIGRKKRRRDFALIGSPNTCYSVLFKGFSPENRTPQRLLKLGKSVVKTYDLNDMKRKSTFYTPLQGSCKSYVLSFSLMHYGPLQS